jgi:hypothetical protein|tara:strand:- start:21716 stop:21901 length:186 start_codon:yes stop_codon:yes gene_type:complete
MKLINDKNDPDLVGTIDSIDDFYDVSNMVNNANQDLRDSGFNQYQYKTEMVGKKVYVRQEI